MATFVDEYGTAAMREAAEENRRQANIQNIRERAAAGELNRGLNVKEIMDLTGMSFREAGSLSGAAATGRTRDPRNFNAIALADDPGAALREATGQMINQGNFFETGNPRVGKKIDVGELVGDVQGNLALQRDSIGGDPYLRLNTITPEGTLLSQTGLSTGGFMNDLNRLGLSVSQEQLDALRADAAQYYAQFGGNDSRGQQLLGVLGSMTPVQQQATGIANLLYQDRLNGYDADRSYRKDLPPPPRQMESEALMQAQAFAQQPVTQQPVAQGLASTEAPAFSYMGTALPSTSVQPSGVRPVIFSRPSTVPNEGIMSALLAQYAEMI